MKGFWINSQYDFPLVLIPAVFIGDSLILPVLNYRIYFALKHVMVFLKPRTVYTAVLFCLLISIAINSYTHYLWFHDDFTGFMDPQIGKISMAGWWHFMFSIFQMSIILLFSAFWLLTIKQQDEKTFQAFEKAIYVFMVFTIINSSGLFINRDIIFSRSLVSDIALTNLITTFMPLITVFLFLSGLRRIHKSTFLNLDV
jgi:hypothetical protein